MKIWGKPSRHRGLVPRAQGGRVGSSSNQQEAAWLESGPRRGQ